MSEAEGLAGLTVTLLMLGVLFSMLTASLSLSLPPSLSVAVAVQEMLSPFEAMLVERARLLLVPRLVLSVSLVQA